MATYITQGRFTQDALKGMIAKPEDRAEAVAQLIERVGGKFLAYYITSGDYDFLIISEGPSNENALAATIAAAAVSGVTDMKTSMALTSREAKGTFARAGEVVASFRPPGAR